MGETPPQQGHFELPPQPPQQPGPPDGPPAEPGQIWSAYPGQPYGPPQQPGPYGPPPPAGPYGQPGPYGPPQPPYFLPPPKQSKVWLWVLLSVVGGLLVLGILVAVAVPVFFSARSEANKGACKDNMRTIDGAIMQYSAVNRGTYPDSISALVPEYLREMPRCPEGGSYTLSGSSPPRAVCPNGHTY